MMSWYNANCAPGRTACAVAPRVRRSACAEVLWLADVADAQTLHSKSHYSAHYRVLLYIYLNQVVIL